MTEPRPSAGLGMAWTASQYQCVNLLVPVTGKAGELILPADPRRWFVRFDIIQAALTVLFVAPGPLLDGTGPMVVGNVPRESKWRDEMAATVGEWYAWSDAPGNVFVQTVVYVGR